MKFKRVYKPKNKETFYWSKVVGTCPKDKNFLKTGTHHVWGRGPDCERASDCVHERV